MATLLACTWNPDLLERIGLAPAEEEMKRGDLNGDKLFTISDVMEICKILARQAK